VHYKKVVNYTKNDHNILILVKKVWD